MDDHLHSAHDHRRNEGSLAVGDFDVPAVKIGTGCVGSTDRLRMLERRPKTKRDLCNFPTDIRERAAANYRGDLLRGGLATSGVRAAMRRLVVRPPARR